MLCRASDRPAVLDLLWDPNEPLVGLLLAAPFALPAGPRPRRHRRHHSSARRAPGPRDSAKVAPSVPRAAEKSASRPRRSWQTQSRAVAPITRFRKRAAAGCCLMPKAITPGPWPLSRKTSSAAVGGRTDAGGGSAPRPRVRTLMLYEPPRETSACSSPARACVSKHLGGPWWPLLLRVAGAAARPRYAGVEVHRLVDCRGDAAVRRAQRDDWASSAAEQLGETAGLRAGRRTLERRCTLVDSPPRAGVFRRDGPAATGGPGVVGAATRQH
jgi:hypothetical protein